MNRKFYIVIVIIIILALGIGGYFIFYKSSASSQVTQTGPKLQKISDDNIISPVPSYDGNSIWYFNSAGQLFHRTFDGSALDEYPLPALNGSFIQAIWPSTGNDFIVLANSTSGQIKYYYENASKQYKPLPQNIKSLDWMPDGRRIAYIWQSGDNAHQQLMVANADVTGYKAIKDVFWPDLTVRVSPDGQSALLFRSINQDVNKIYLADLSSGQFTTLVEQGKNIGVQWIDSRRFIYSQVLDNQYKIMLYNISSNQTADLNVNASLDKVSPDKDGEYLYADVGGGQGDAIWKIDLSTKQQQKVYQFDNMIMPRSLFMNDQTICFINFDGKLYTLTQ